MDDLQAARASNRACNWQGRDYRAIGTLLHANSAHLARARDRSRAPDGWARGRAVRASKRACNQQGLGYTARASLLHATGAQIGPGEASGRASSRAPANAQLPPPPTAAAVRGCHITHTAALGCQGLLMRELRELCGCGSCSPWGCMRSREPTAAQAGPQRSPCGKHCFLRGQWMRHAHG
jgi:hypothetical protein